MSLHLVHMPRFRGTPTAYVEAQGLWDPTAFTKRQREVRGDLTLRREPVPTEAPQQLTTFPALPSPLKASGTSWLSAVTLEFWLPSKAATPEPKSVSSK